MRVDRALLYRKVLRMLGPRVRAAHELMVERGDTLPRFIPRHRVLTDEEVDELVWRVYCLTLALDRSFVECHPDVVKLAGEWWSASETEAQGWEEFCASRLA